MLNCLVKIAPGPVPPPMEVAPETITSNSALVTWMAPPMPNGDLLSYTVNVVLISGISNMSSETRRRKRQVTSPINSECIEGGVDGVNRNISVDASMTSLTLRNLCKSQILVVGICLVEY